MRRGGEDFVADREAAAGGASHLDARVVVAGYATGAGNSSRPQLLEKPAELVDVDQVSSGGGVDEEVVDIVGPQLPEAGLEALAGRNSPVVARGAPLPPSLLQRRTQRRHSGDGRTGRRLQPRQGGIRRLDPELRRYGHPVPASAGKAAHLGLGPSEPVNACAAGGLRRSGVGADSGSEPLRPDRNNPGRPRSCPLIPHLSPSPRSQPYGYSSCSSCSSPARPRLRPTPSWQPPRPHL